MNKKESKEVSNLIIRILDLYAMEHPKYWDKGDGIEYNAKIYVPPKLMKKIAELADKLELDASDVLDSYIHDIILAGIIYRADIYFKEAKENKVPDYVLKGIAEHLKDLL